MSQAVSAGTRRPLPVVHVPTDDELERGLSATLPLAERVRYVRGLLRPAAEMAREAGNLEAYAERLETAMEGMRGELKALHEKLGDLDPGDRKALDQRYDMLGKMARARSAVDRLEAAQRDAVREMREALKK